MEAEAEGIRVRGMVATKENTHEWLSLKPSYNPEHEVIFAIETRSATAALSGSQSTR